MIRNANFVLRVEGACNLIDHSCCAAAVVVAAVDSSGCCCCCYCCCYCGCRCRRLAYGPREQELHRGSNHPGKSVVG